MTPEPDECPDCTVRICPACERAEWAAENDAPSSEREAFIALLNKCAEAQS